MATDRLTLAETCGSPGWLPLRRAARQACDNVPLQNDEEDEHRRGDDDGHGHQVVPVRAELTDDPVQRNRERLDPLLGGQRQRERELAPRHEKGERTDHDETGTDRRHDDPNDGPDGAETVEARGLFHLDGEELEVRPEQDDRER